MWKICRQIQRKMIENVFRLGFIITKNFNFFRNDATLIGLSVLIRLIAKCKAT